MYIKQGHMGYINLVKNRSSYKLNMREQQWLQREDIKVNSGANSCGCSGKISK